MACLAHLGVAVAGAVLNPDDLVFSPRMDIRTTFHKLRHCSATELIRAGVDIQTVAGQLGHAEGGTTLTYYASWPDVT